MPIQFASRWFSHGEKSWREAVTAGVGTAGTVALGDTAAAEVEPFPERTMPLHRGVIERKGRRQSAE